MPILAVQEPSIPLVVLLGLGMVFVGLICIIIICYLLGVIIRLLRGSRNDSGDESSQATAPAVTAVPAVSANIENRQQFVAAVSAAIAEELGTDVSAIRITSIKKL